MYCLDVQKREQHFQKVESTGGTQLFLTSGVGNSNK